MYLILVFFFFFFSSRRRHTRSDRDWSSDVCSSDLKNLTAQRIKARVRRGPDDVAVPFDEHVVHGAVVASKFFQVAALGRNEVSNLFWLVKVSNVVTTESRDEVRIRNKLLPRFSRRLEMWRIMSPEATALETEIAVRCFRRRNGTRQLSNGHGVLFIANIDDPVRQIDLIAIRIGRFAVGEHKSPVEDAAINRVEGDAHSRVLWRRLEPANFSLMRRIREIKNNESVAAKRAVTTIAAIFQFFRNVHRAVQSGERRLVCDDLRWNQLGPHPFVILGFLAFA